MRYQKMILFLFLGSCSITACEDVIDVDLDEGEPLMVVDAFLNNKQEVQTIHLSRSVPYLSGEDPPGISGAAVSVTDLQSGKKYVFEEGQSGTYQWRPHFTANFGEPGKTYELRIDLGEDSYTAESQVHPVTLIDSIVYEYEEKDPFQDAGYQAYFIAFDLKGQTDYYFIRSYKNGILRSRNIDFEVCIDAAYGEGADGLQFIEPIADFTPGDDPYQLGDSASVEIASIDKRTYGFLSQVIDQTSNSGLFATPPANMRTNVECISASPGLKAVGWFAVSAVSSGGVRIEGE